MYSGDKDDRTPVQGNKTGTSLDLMVFKKI